MPQQNHPDKDEIGNESEQTPTEKDRDLSQESDQQPSPQPISSNPDGESLEDAQRKPAPKDRQFIVILAVLGIVFLLSAWALIQYQSWKFKEVYFTYNGFEITKAEHGYRIKLIVNEQEDTPIYVRLRNRPQDLENISVRDLNPAADVKKKEMMFITIDPDQNLTGKTVVAALEIDNILDNPALYNLKVNSAVTKANDPNKNVMTCEDANETTGIIFLTLGPEEKVENKNGCLILQGTDEFSIIRTADTFIYYVLGIMPSQAEG